MFKKLTQEKKIKLDLQRYTLAVSKIQNVSVKQQFETYLQDYKLQLNLIDEGHSTTNNGYIKPSRNRENVERLNEIRTKLETLF